MARKRRSYESRSGLASPHAGILAKAFLERPVYIEDADGYMVRQWKPEELQRFKNSDIAQALRGRRAVEWNEMLEHIPPSGIKYAITKHWIIKAQPGDFYIVTDLGAIDLKLPLKANGCKIKFAKVMGQ